MNLFQDFDLQAREKQAAWMNNAHLALIEESASSPSFSSTAAHQSIPSRSRRHGSKLCTFSSHPSSTGSKAFNTFRNSLQDNNFFSSSSSDENEVELSQEFDEQLPSMGLLSPPLSGHLDTAAAKVKEDPPLVQGCLPRPSPLVEDHDGLTSGSLNFGLSCGAISLQFDAQFLSVSKKSVLGGLQHFDEPSSVDLTPFFLVHEDENDIIRFHDATLLKIDSLYSQLDSLRLITYDSFLPKEVKIVLKAMVQETFWRLGKYTAIISDLAKQLNCLQSVSEKSLFTWDQLEGSLVDFCQEMSNIWHSLGLQPSISTSGSVQWVHSEVSVYKFTPLINGCCVLLASIQSSILQLHLPPHLQPLIELASHLCDENSKEPELVFHLPAPTFYKGFSVMLGLESASDAKIRLSSATPLAPADPSLGIHGWGWKTSEGSSDPFLSSVWLKQGLYWFKTNQVLCDSDNWFLLHQAWAFENSDARVSFLIFSVLSRFCRSIRSSPGTHLSFLLVLWWRPGRLWGSLLLPSRFLIKLLS